MKSGSAVTDRDRAHFAAIARAKAEEKREQIGRAASDPTAEGIRTGLELAALASWTPAVEALEDRRADGQYELYLRWRRLRRGERPPG